MYGKRVVKIVVSTIKCHVQIHARGRFSNKGFGKLLLFARTLNSKLMCKIYKNGLLRQQRNGLVTITLIMESFR